MSNWITGRRARLALALCLAAWPAWQMLTLPNPSSAASADTLLRSATEWFAPSELARRQPPQTTPVPLGLRN